MDSDKILKRVRAICLKLADAEETTSWGHPNFKVHGKTFAVYERFKGEWCVCIRVALEHQDLFLKDPRFLLTPYIGKKGWVSLRLHAAPLKWPEIRELIVASYRLVDEQR